MLGTVLDAAIGLAFVFFLVAVTCSALVEVVSNWRRKRARLLLRGLRDLLDTPRQAEGSSLTWPSAGVVTAVRAEGVLYHRALKAVTPTGPPVLTADVAAVAADRSAMTWVERVMGHPLVRPLKQTRASGGQTRNPSYLPAPTFYRALVDLVVADHDGEFTMSAVRAGVSSLPSDTPFKPALAAMAKSAGNDVSEFRRAVEHWYESAMDRVSGTYKRWAKRWTIMFALGVVLAFQVDTVSIARSLYVDEPVRTATVAAVTNETLCDTSAKPKEEAECVRKAVRSLGADGLPLGWTKDSWTDGWTDRLLRILGWLLTVGAATFGAPFWFDQLNRLGSLRNAGRKPVASPAVD